MSNHVGLVVNTLPVSNKQWSTVAAEYSGVVRRVVNHFIKREYAPKPPACFWVWHKCRKAGLVVNLHAKHGKKGRPSWYDAAAVACGISRSKVVECVRLHRAPRKPKCFNIWHLCRTAGLSSFNGRLTPWYRSKRSAYTSKPENKAKRAKQGRDQRRERGLKVKPNPYAELIAKTVSSGAWAKEAGKLCGIRSRTASRYAVEEYAPRVPVCFWLWHKCKVAGLTAVKAKRRAFTRSDEAVQRERDAQKSPERKAVRQAWVERNRENTREWYRNYNRSAYKDNPTYRIRACLKSRLYKMLKQQRTNKANTFVEIIGCSKEFLEQWLESQFKRGMTWDNHGKAWHIDHICPCSSFDLTDPEQVKKAWHYTNLRPLWARENISKQDKIIPHQPELLMSLAHTP